MIKIITLMDNLNSEHKHLIAEHGLSFYIETEDTKLLFDFGAGESAWRNAEYMNIPMEEITYLVFSHSHYDHAAGFIPFGKHWPGKTAVYGPGFFQEKYAAGGHKYTYLGCGFSREYVKAHTGRQILCEDMIKLAPDIWAVGGFDRSHDFETVPARFVKEGPKGIVQDQFEDEICLAADTPRGLVVIVGCSHPGILNILTTVQSRLNRPILAVIGGAHLVEADEDRIRRTILEMKSMGIQLLGLNHCSGMEMERIIQEDEQITGCHLGCGDVLMF